MRISLMMMKVVMTIKIPNKKKKMSLKVNQFKKFLIKISKRKK